MASARNWVNTVAIEAPDSMPTHVAAALLDITARRYLPFWHPVLLFVPSGLVRHVEQLCKDLPPVLQWLSTVQACPPVTSPRGNSAYRSVTQHLSRCQLVAGQPVTIEHPPGEVRFSLPPPVCEFAHAGIQACTMPCLWQFSNPYEERLHALMQTYPACLRIYSCAHPLPHLSVHPCASKSHCLQHVSDVYHITATQEQEEGAREGRWLLCSWDPCMLCHRQDVQRWMRSIPQLFHHMYQYVTSTLMTTML